MHHLVLSINAGKSPRVGRSKPLNQSIVPEILNIQTHPRGSGAIKVYLLGERGVANTPCISIHWQRWEDESYSYVCIVFLARSICHSALPGCSILSLALNSAARDLRQWRGSQENWKREAAQTTESCRWNSQAPHEEFNNWQTLANENYSV